MFSGEKEKLHNVANTPKLLTSKIPIRNLDRDVARLRKGASGVDSPTCRPRKHINKLCKFAVI